MCNDLKKKCHYRVHPPVHKNKTGNQKHTASGDTANNLFLSHPHIKLTNKPCGKPFQALAKTLAITVLVSH